MITQLRFTLFALVMLAAVSSFAQAPNISYGPEYMTAGFQIEEVKPSNSGGAATGPYSVSPALPGGLSINGTNGIITGTPTVASPATNYTVTTSNTSGSNSAVINITVSPTPSYISYTTPQVFTAGAAITSLTPANNTGGGFAGTFYTKPALPAGLVIDTLSGVISGTPNVAGPATIYTVYYAFSGPSEPGDPDNNPPVSQTSPDSAKVSITVSTAGSSDAGLSNMQVSNGKLKPSFATGTYSYSINVGNGLKTMTVTPTADDPSATIKVDGKTVPSGKPSPYLPLVAGPNTVPILVTAGDGSTTQTYTLTINEANSSNDNLTGLKISAGTLSPAFNLNTTGYTVSVPYAISSIIITPTAADTTAVVTVNNKNVVSGSPSRAIALTAGANTISTEVTAQNGATKTYTITVTRTAPSTNCNLSALAASKGKLTPSFLSTTTNYTDVLTNGTTSVTVTPTSQVSISTITVNGTAVTSGSRSGPIALAVGSNTITTVVTAQDGTTKKTYAINVIRPSMNAKLSDLTTNAGAVTPVFDPAITSYTLSVTNATSTIKVTPTIAVTGATVKINGTAVTSGTSSAAIALGIGSNTITTVVTAQDGSTTDTYTLTVTRPAGLNIPDAEITVQAPTDKPLFDDDVLVVHQGISPNGDGVNDFLVIDGILAYPDNHLSIMNRDGQLVYELKGYDNATKVFDGHSNKNGQMQLPGTYFYSLEYSVSGAIKHKTGFLILKY